MLCELLIVHIVMADLLKQQSFGWRREVKNDTGQIKTDLHDILSCNIHVTDMITENAPFHFIISHTKYKFNPVDFPWIHSHTLTLLIITMTLTAAALILCHTIYWNFYRGRLSDSTTLCRAVGCVWDIPCGMQIIIHSVLSYCQHDITVTPSNDKEVCRYYGKSRAVFNRKAISLTEM